MIVRKRRRGTIIIYLAPKTNKQRERQRNVLDALAYKRRNPKVSMTEAAHRANTTLATVRRYAGSAVELRSGRYDVKAIDSIPRDMEFITPGGNAAITVRNSRAASRIAKHRNAVRRAIITFGGDTGPLETFEGKSIRAGGKVYPFITDYQTLNRLARAGALDFLDIYATTSVLQ